MNQPFNPYQHNVDILRGFSENLLSLSLRLPFVYLLFAK